MSKEIKSNNGKISVFALAMLNVVAVVSLRGLPAEAEYGLSSVFYYVFAAIVFLIPVSLVAAELATGWSEKGGVFRWVGEAFGPRIALVAVFMLWIEVTVWFPTALTFGSVSLAFMGPDTTWDQALSENKFFILLIVLGIYWFATFVALRGTSAFAKLAKWGGLIGTIIPGIVLIVLGFSYVFFSGIAPKVDLTWGNLIPDFSNFNNIVLAASIFLFYAGMEMNAIHVKEVEDAPKNYPIAIGIAAIGTVSVFILGTLAIAFIIPQQDISLTQSLLIAYDALFAWAGISWASPIIAACLALGVLAGVVGWVAGPSSALLVVAKGGYLPRFWQKTNKHGMATHIMLAQALLVTLISTVFVVLPSVQAAYQILSQLTVVLYLIMYLLMFAAAIHLRYSQPNRPRPYKIPGGDIGMWIVAGLGFIGSLIAFLFSYIPPSQIAVGSPAEFVGFLVALTLIFIMMPLLIYKARQPHWKDPSVTDFALFTWELEGVHPGVINPSDKITHHLNK